MSFNSSCTRQHLKAVLLKELLELRVQAMKAQMGQRAMLLKTRLLEQMNQEQLIDIDDEGRPFGQASVPRVPRVSALPKVLPWVLGVLVVIALISVIALMVAKKRAGQRMLPNLGGSSQPYYSY